MFNIEFISCCYLYCFGGRVTTPQTLPFLEAAILADRFISLDESVSRSDHLCSPSFLKVPCMRSASD